MVAFDRVGQAPFRITVTGVGLATAQGASGDLLGQAGLAAPVAIPAPAAPSWLSRVHRPARGAAPGVRGVQRMAALARLAFKDCLAAGPPPPSGTPLLVASCNGGATAWDAESWQRGFDTAPLLAATPWQGQSLPVA